MQTPGVSSFHTWARDSAGVVGGAASIIFAWLLTKVLNRKSKKELQKTDAETEDIKIRTGVRVFEIFDKMTENAGEVQRLQSQLTDLLMQRNQKITELIQEIECKDETIAELEDKIFEIQRDKTLLEEDNRHLQAINDAYEQQRRLMRAGKTITDIGQKDP